MYIFTVFFLLSLTIAKSFKAMQNLNWLRQIIFRKSSLLCIRNYPYQLTQTDRNQILIISSTENNLWTWLWKSISFAVLKKVISQENKVKRFKTTSCVTVVKQWRDLNASKSRHILQCRPSFSSAIGRPRWQKRLVLREQSLFMSEEGWGENVFDANKFPDPNLGPVSRKSRTLFGPEKPFVRLRPAYSVKLIFSYVVEGIKT